NGAAVTGGATRASEPSSTALAGAAARPLNESEGLVLAQSGKLAKAPAPVASSAPSPTPVPALQSAQNSPASLSARGANPPANSRSYLASSSLALPPPETTPKLAYSFQPAGPLSLSPTSQTEAFVQENMDGFFGFGKMATNSRNRMLVRFANEYAKAP